MKFSDLGEAFTEHPLTALFVVIVVVFHILVLVYGFMLLWNSEDKSKVAGKNFATSSQSSFSGRLKKFPGADEELKKLVEKEIKQD